MIMKLKQQAEKFLPVLERYNSKICRKPITRSIPERQEIRQDMFQVRQIIRSTLTDRVDYLLHQHILNELKRKYYAILCN